jgi:predicted acyl esterase
VSFLSRVFGVRPRRPHAVRVQRDLVIPAGDGVPLLANRFLPAGIDQPPLVLLLSPYGRGVALDRMPQLLAERGYQVLYVSLRGTGGSGGDFDGFTIHPADGYGTLSWLREQPWFGGVLATWGASYLGFAQWELAARDIPEWKIAVIQDAPSEFAHLFMYPGGGFALGNALAWVQIVDRMFRANGGTARQFLGVFTGPKAMRRAVATLPVAEADVALVAPIPATDATSAPQNHSPPAHAYKPATAPCSTMPSTPPQCGYPSTADVRCRFAARSSRLAVDLISRAARTERSDQGGRRCATIPVRRLQRRRKAGFLCWPTLEPIAA